MTIQRTALASIALLALAACAENTPAGESWICNSPGTSCTAYVSGWTEDEARGGCNTAASTFADGECPSGRVAACTQTYEGRVFVTHYYENFGGTGDAVGYGLMTCQAAGGDFTSP